MESKLIFGEWEARDDETSVFVLTDSHTGETRSLKLDQNHYGSISKACLMIEMETGVKNTVWGVITTENECEKYWFVTPLKYNL